MPEKDLSNSELEALVSLLDDEDDEVVNHVETKIISMGNEIIPFLEEQWERIFNPVVQKRLEDLIHTLQFDLLTQRMEDWKVSDQDDLLKGLWIIATYQYPDLDYDELKKEIEQIYYEAWLEFKSDVYPIDKVKILNSVLFNKLKFSANTKNFHSPGNSMINIVLESKKGNPLTLSAIYVLVAQKLKMPVYGVNLPNLFICTYKDENYQFYINAFNRGLIFTKEDIDNYIAHLKLSPMDIFYEPCSNIDIIRRMLRNLNVAFDKLGYHDKAEEIKILLNIFADDPEGGMEY